VFLVHVAERHDVFLGEAVEMGFAAAPGAEEGDVELVAGRVGAEEPGAGKDHAGGAGERDGFEEVATFHGSILMLSAGDVKPCKDRAQPNGRGGVDLRGGRFEDAN
jgi:hypothetical protein